MQFKEKKKIKKHPGLQFTQFLGVMTQLAQPKSELAQTSLNPV